MNQIKRTKRTRFTTYIAGGVYPTRRRGGQNLDVWIALMSAYPSARSAPKITGEKVTLHITPANDPTGCFARKFSQIMQRDTSPERVSR